MRNRILGLVVAAGLVAAAAPALATWSATETSGGWYVRQGDLYIAMPDEGTARDTARRLNKAVERAEKRAEKAEAKGVVSRPGTPCADPNSTVLC
jgi:L-2-hydroxyglutarate oxidase LhgO